MLKQLTSVILISLLSVFAFAQDTGEAIPEKDLQEVKAIKKPAYSPTIGLGIGMFKFYGDILDAGYGNPLVSNLGYDLHVKQRLNPFLAAKFYVLFGSLSANERSLERNLNFKTEITTGGFALIYNFANFLPKKRVVSPFVTLGIESVEFHSKTDLFDENGNEYNYWSDGSIRDIAENDPNSSQAVVIQRDYHYETDLRNSNFDDLGKYPERTFSIPVGAGVKMHMTDHIDFSIGATMHYTFTDLIDNVYDGSAGERISTHAGNSSNDNFLMSSFSISYNFRRDNKEEVEEVWEELVDYMEFDADDEDSDGVIDFIDECPWTPPGVEVDEKGCPLDKDGDLVPNYKDDELETRESAPVSPNGVELTDTMIYYAYRAFMDSTGEFAEVSKRVIAAEKPKKKYKVQVGKYTEAIDAEMVDKFLSIPDVEINNLGDSMTVIAVGDYDNLPDAVKRKMQLTEQGFDATLVVEQKKDGSLVSVGDEANNMVVEGLGDGANSNEVFFRIQLGAFSKKQTNIKFGGISDVMEIKADDGLYKYLIQKSFKSIEDAATHKINMAINNGVEDAFIVAYKGGKRIRLKDAGVSTTVKEKGISNTNDTFYDKAKIKFKVQVGIYKNQLPTEVLSKFMSLEGVEQTEIENGLTRYTSGSFTKYEEANAYKAKLLELGLGGSFVISLHGEDLIPLEKAREVLGE